MFCLIVDTNMMHWFTNTSEEISQIVIELLKRQKGKLYIGGRLKSEMPQGLRPWLDAGVRAGWIMNVPDGEVDRDECWLVDRGDLESNDHHVIALARVSGARVLVSRDRALVRDFKDRSLVSYSSGKVLSVDGSTKRIRRFLQGGRLCARLALVG